MTQNLDLHFFTNEQLKAHDLDIATKVHQATVASLMRRVNQMNSGQILNATLELALSVRVIAYFWSFAFGGKLSEGSVDGQESMQWLIQREGI